MAALKFKELGNAKYKEGKYEDAVEAYGQAIEDDPTVAAYYTNRCVVVDVKFLCITCVCGKGGGGLFQVCKCGC